MAEQEIEVKFFIHDLKKIETRLLNLKALLIQPRIREINYRYDLPDGSLRARGQVLRLRYDKRVILTYKGPSKIVDGVFTRTELETTMGDLETGQHILEALGYVQIMIYEKFRTVYAIDDCQIMLDELPYGDFVEIEGSDAASIRKIALIIGLDFESAVGLGYTKLFENYNKKHGLPNSNLTFDVFGERKPSAEKLSVRPAD